MAKDTDLPVCTCGENEVGGKGGVFQKGRLSRKLRQYAGASLTESSFLLNRDKCNRIGLNPSAKNDFVHFLGSPLGVKPSWGLSPMFAFSFSDTSPNHFLLKIQRTYTSPKSSTPDCQDMGCTMMMIVEWGCYDQKVFISDART